MGTKFTLAEGLTVGVLLGSKLGPKPYETFASGMRWLRNTRVVSRPIEAAADHASGLVRSKGEELTDRAASSVYRTIVGAGQEPLIVEARVTTAEIPSTTD